jgi:DmsE family decaheme c-type cytochrome
MKRISGRSLLGAMCAVGFLLAGTLATDAGAAEPAASGNAQKEGLAQDAKCTVCHNESWRKPVLSIYQTPHGNRADSRAPLCTSCHGQSEQHQKDPGGAHPDVVFADESKNISPTDKRNGTCLNCHETGKRLHWAGSKHQSEDLACANCHTVHAPQDKVLTKATQPEVCFACHKTERAQTHRISHHPINEGKVVCSDCHNPHGSTGPKLLVKDSVNDTCYTCHAEKRGPFLWEHAPVTDDCTNCHTPHGSTNSPLLKARAPWLCQECHSGDHAKNIYSGANLPGGNATTFNGVQGLANQSPPAQLNARACMNCHVLVHGSNHPAGAKFQR